MVFSSFPIYQDSPNSWNQQRAQLLQLTQLAEPPPQPTGPTNSARPVSMAERARLAKIPPPDLARIKCPRCDSNNTKFCYFNNYSLSQPRYFCKTCRRYWTHGGALRDVPVGGGCRRNKRSKTSHSPSEPMLRPPPKSPLMSPFRQASANVGLDFDGIQQGDPAERGTVALEQYRYHMPPPPPPPFLGGGFDASPAALGFLSFDGEDHVAPVGAPEKMEVWDGGELSGNGSGGWWLEDLPGLNSSSLGA